MAHLTTLALYVALLAAACGGQTGTPAVPSVPPQQEFRDQPNLTPAEIIQLKTKAADGDPVAQVSLGKAYQQGNGVQQNDDLAVSWYRKAADQGNPVAQNDLGVMYRTGQGVEKSKEEAVNWYRKAAKLGNPEAIFNLGVSYYNGDGVSSNVFSAYAWFLLAQDAGNAAANDAVRRTAASMSQGETADTLMQIAEMFEKGEEVRQSYAEEVRWYRKAAASDRRAKVRLADILANGRGVPRDFGEALKLCRSAASDYGPAQFCLGFMYRNGWGVVKDPSEAVSWYQKAAAAGHPQAMLDLAEMYSTGEGTKTNRTEALLLLWRATLGEVKGAQQKASALLKTMSEAEVKQVKKNLRKQNFDPDKVFAAIQAGSPS